MPRFSANLDFLFTELTFRERFEAAAMSGFRGVEFLFPYEVPADELASLARDNGLEVVLFNIWPGDWDAGWRGLAGVPGQEDEFARCLTEALDYARALNCRRLHAMAGLESQGANFSTLIGNLRFAAAEAAADGVVIMTEPINRRDMPGYLVHRTAEAREIIEAVGAPNVRLQLDLYHRQMEEGDVAGAISEFADVTEHYQIAASPDRGEPHAGDLDFRELLGLIDATGYAGWVGCEYRPRAGTAAGLEWGEALGVSFGRLGEVCNDSTPQEDEPTITGRYKK
jgi:2-dehydrotetronate isomerase